MSAMRAGLPVWPLLALASSLCWITAPALAVTTVTGTIVIEATVLAGTEVPANTVVTVTGGAGLEGDPIGFHVVSRSQTVKMNPSKTTTVEISLPYRCTISKSTDTISVTLSLYAAGLPDVSTQRIIALPTGSTTTVALPAAL